MAEPVQVEPRPDAGLISDLENANWHPLWDRYKSITPMEPRAVDENFIWRWRDIEPFTARSATEIAIEDVERRALIMAHPAFDGRTQTTSNLLSAFSVLEPGDHARPHRHTAAAIRFSTRAEGAATIVNGRRCEMLPGDLILTPPYCWHGHINASNHRTVWFDAANMPLINALDANFFEPGVQYDDAFWEVDEGDEKVWAAAGMRPTDHSHTADHSPKYRYPGADTRKALSALSAAPDGVRSLQYVNPLTGGPVMSTLDCYADRLTAGHATQAHRYTWNQICLVVRGSGTSTIGNSSIDWSEHDVFTVPHWNWFSHTADKGDADLFVVTDRVIYDRLGLARTEDE